MKKRLVNICIFLAISNLIIAAPTTTQVINSTLLNGSFENGTGNEEITGWLNFSDNNKTQRIQNNASQGAWSLVIGKSTEQSEVEASAMTSYEVVEGDIFNLSFRWLPKLNWDVADRVRWRLFTTSDDTVDGEITEISSGSVGGFANGAAYQTATMTSIAGVNSANEERKLWLQIYSGAGDYEFARVDDVVLSVVTDVQAAYVPLDVSFLTAYYPLEGNVEDYSIDAVQYNGNWNAGEAYTAGKINEQSADLSGANASFNVPHNLAKDFSMSFWIKTTSTAPAGSQWYDGNGIIDGTINGVNNDIGVSLNGDKICFGVGGPDTSIFSQTAVNDGNWHHVSVQRHNASGNMRLFINGVLESQVMGPAGARNDASPLSVGSLANGTNFLNAYIDDIRIFNNIIDGRSVSLLHSTSGNYDGDEDSDLEELNGVSSWTDSKQIISVPTAVCTVGPRGCQLSIEAFAGRTYSLQRSYTLLEDSWSVIGAPVSPRYHGPLVFTDSAPLAQKAFYRITIEGHGPVVEKKPNIVIIYGDDVGYGDVKAYNPASKINTPNIDRLAADGIRFTDGHCTASTCTPSRYSMLTGVFAFRDDVTIIPPTGALSIPENTYTLADMMKDAGYNTAVVGKWHLGIGLGDNSIDWNGDIKPGPLEIGFDTCFMIPTTNDRVPCVYLKDYNIVGLDPNDPLYVQNSSYAAVNVAGSTQYPHDDFSAHTYYDVPGGHNNSVINGIGRIGYMSGAQTALWDDETMAQTFVQKAKDYINAQNADTPFFLYFASQDIHVPRAPHPDFQGATDLGFRGDAMVQFDWATGEIMKALEDRGFKDDTIVIFSSDNGPVYNDGGYNDGGQNDASQGHDASGIYRGGKYGILEAGTRVPFIVTWPAKIKPGVSDALVSQVDLMASLSNLLEVPLPGSSARDSRNILPALMGIDPVGLPFTVEQNTTGAVTALRLGNMKYTSEGRLYNLTTDPEELNNLSGSDPAAVAAMAAQLTEIINGAGVRE